jgi:deuterolysin
LLLIIQHHIPKPTPIYSSLIMRLITPVALLALMQGISASPVDVKLNTPGLHVTLEQVDNTRIKAVVKNTGSEEVTFVHLNFFQDNGPVKKVSLFRDSTFFST